MAWILFDKKTNFSMKTITLCVWDFQEINQMLQIDINAFQHIIVIISRNENRNMLIFIHANGKWFLSKKNLQFKSIIPT